MLLRSASPRTGRAYATEGRTNTQRRPQAACSASGCPVRRRVARASARPRPQEADPSKSLCTGSLRRSQTTASHHGLESFKLIERDVEGCLLVQATGQRLRCGEVAVLEKFVA